MNEQITRFKGKNSFLSNFYYSPVYYNGIIFATVEQAFQAAKSNDLKTQKLFALAPTPGEAKSYGKQIKLREDWELVKVSIMKDLLKQKFSKSPLKEMLLETNTKELIEGNNHGDTYWGTVNGKGENMLGKLLMEVRSELQHDFN